MTFSTEDFAKALDAQQLDFQKGSVIDGTVYSHESEGALLDVGGKSAAFLPWNELSVRPVTDTAAALPIGETRSVMVMREQDMNGQILVSIRQLELRQSWARLQEMQANKESLTVRVTGTNRGGVTVDAEGLRGFVPRSHLHQREDLQALVGTILTVNVLDLDRDANKLVLSQRQAAQAAAMQAIEIGQLVEGTVVNLKPYGAFVEFSGTTGLLHINQISRKRIPTIEDVLSLGQELKVVVLDIDELKGRISLGTKILEKHPGEILEHWNTVMDEASDRLVQAGSVSAERD